MDKILLCMKSDDFQVGPPSYENSSWQEHHDFGRHSKDTMMNGDGANKKGKSMVIRSLLIGFGTILQVRLVEDQIILNMSL